MIKKRLRSGKLVDVANLTEDDIDIYDIVHSLARQCRYDGHVPRHYSVLEHSILTCKAIPEQCSPHIKLLALLHDATECYIGDIQAGIKDRLLIRADWDDEPVTVREFEAGLMRLICEKFGVDVRMHYWSIVKGIDEELTELEMRHFFNGEKYVMFEKKPESYYMMEFSRLFWELCSEIDALEEQCQG